MYANEYDLSLLDDPPDVMPPVEQHRSLFSIINELDPKVVPKMVELLGEEKKRDYYLITPHCKKGLEWAWFTAYLPVPFGSVVMLSPGCTPDQLPRLIDMIKKPDEKYAETADAIRKANKWFSARHHTWHRYAENLASAFRRYADSEVHHVWYVKIGQKVSITTSDR